MGIWTTKKTLCQGFRWVLGDGADFTSVENPWLRNKKDFRVDNNHICEGRNELVSSLTLQGSKQWDTSQIREHFTEDEAKPILAIYVPQCEDGLPAVAIVSL